eukprot:CAMPEP_0197461712 /NCGR_PEP_ID=MMETSP1175-20131217/57257_1 /TAXON_ID=1003142 /ORGANISM="Triceratium dubium, Strain CCMP147" /LENGTH=44 /DNA_ID= /DNA_START= /DNA_END= /DNA_ORIENTATION=
MIMYQTAMLLLLCTSTSKVVESQPYPCPNYKTNEPDVVAGSNID